MLLPTKVQRAQGGAEAFGTSEVAATAKPATKQTIIERMGWGWNWVENPAQKRGVAHPAPANKRAKPLRIRASAGTKNNLARVGVSGK